VQACQVLVLEADPHRALRSSDAARGMDGSGQAPALDAVLVSYEDLPLVAQDHVLDFLAIVDVADRFEAKASSRVERDPVEAHRASVERLGGLQTLERRQPLEPLGVAEALFEK
jgi:hypothetical protein